MLLSYMGLVPYCFINNKLCVSHLHSLYTAVLIVMHVLMRYNEIIKIMHVLVKNTPLTSQTISITVCTLQFVAACINAIIRKKDFMQYANAMINCEYAFKDIMYIEHKKTQRKMYLLAFLWVFVTGTNYALHGHFYRIFLLGEIAVYTINFCYTWFFTGGICISAVLHVSEINQQFEVLNECLKRMHNNTWEESKYDLLLKQKVWKPEVEDLAKIGALHLKLTNCMKEFNKAFAVLQITNYIITFMRLLGAVYFVYVAYYDPRGSYVNVNCIMITIAYTTLWAMVCSTCTATIQQVNKCMLQFDFRIYILLPFKNF